MRETLPSFYAASAATCQQNMEGAVSTKMYHNSFDSKSKKTNFYYIAFHAFDQKSKLNKGMSGLMKSST